MEKECWNCGNYRRFYSKGFCYFGKEDYGRCSKECVIKEKHQSCELWRKRPPNLSVRKAAVIKALEDVAVNVAQIKQILEKEE